jgi:hypothetical protein
MKQAGKIGKTEKTAGGRPGTEAIRTGATVLIGQNVFF